MPDPHDEAQPEIDDAPEVVAHEAGGEEIPCIVDGSTHCETMKPE